MLGEYKLQKTFWLLKKYSSYTWAAEIQRLFTQFVNDFEAWMRTNPPRTTEFEEDVLRSVWYMHGKAVEGLDLLQNSHDKSHAYALLTKGFGFGHMFWHDRWFTDMDTTELEALGFANFWDKYEKPCTGMFRALGAAEHMSNCLLFGPGLRAYKDALPDIKWLPFRKEYDTPLWTPSQFPPLPKPETAIEILSGEEAPVTGIWIPEPLAEDPISADMFKKTGGKQTYCMNFMVQGKIAPKIISEEEYLLAMEQDYRPFPKDRAVRWRLLWKDERYGKNGIPEEEQDYLRVEEETASPSDQQADDGILRCEGGKTCPRSGYWYVWHDPESRHYFNQGEIMPSGVAAQGVLIWYWDNDQSA